tara:strand:- start:26854 stop:27684 length:831 start_codon:yes stop_codon:yes gene_type:complete
MTYEAFEDLQEGSAPVELYTFTIGSTIYRWTSAEDNITEAADVFTAIPIDRGTIKGGGPDTRKEFLVITVAGDNPVVTQYINSVPGVAATVKIERIQRPDGPAFEVITLFNGTISSVAFTNAGRTAKIRIVPLVTSQSKPVPTATYQGLCNHVLYDDGCQVDDTDAAFRLSTAACTAVSGSTITVTGADANGDGYYTGGFVETTGSDDRRLILDQTGTLLTLLLPFTTSPLGTNVTVFAGCDHAISTCSSKFSNVINFGGFAWVPSKNVFATGIRI